MADNDADVAVRAERFAERVGEELADVPALQRARVLNDLATHLQEKNEDGVSLLDQQGSPEEYAAELRSALDCGPPVRGRSRSRYWGIALAAGVAVALLAAAIVVLPRLSLGDGSTTAPTQTPTQDQTASTPTQTQTASPSIAVPNLIGLTQAEARRALAEVKLSLGAVTHVTFASVPRGLVAAMSPAPGSEVPSGSAVDLTVSSGPA
jgi:hypothetical protein